MSNMTHATSQAEFTSAIAASVANNDLENLDWGFRFMVEDELEALRLAYIYRNSKFGVQVRHCAGPRKFSVTVFNELAAKMGVDRS